MARERIAKEDGKDFRLTDQQIKVIRRAQVVTGASIHPDTGTLIPWWSRMSSFMFMGVPLTVGLTMAPPTYFNTMFWQWMNQTYFAGLNFFNRNATTSLMTQMNIYLSFTAAAVSSVAIALVLRRVFAGYAMRASSGNQILFNTTTSFLALAGAGVVNSMVMRSNEMKEGIMLYDEQRNQAGKSKVAAWKAVTQTSFTRIFIYFNMIMVPGFLIGML